MPASLLQLVWGFYVGGKGGGLTRFVIELSRNLPADRFDNHLAGLFNTGTPLEKDWLERLNAEGIPSFCAVDTEGSSPYRDFFRAARNLWKWQSQHKARLVHSHSEFTDAAALLLKFHPSHPRILRTIHNGQNKEWRKRPLRRLFLSNILFPLFYDREVGISPAVTETLDRRPLARWLGKKAVCITNAIDLKRFQDRQVDRKEKRRELNVPAGALLVGSVGRLREEKGFPYYVEAARQVLQERPDVRFLLIGEGELAEALQEQVNAAGMADRFSLTGARKDIDEILPCLDLYVSASLWEGMPTVVLESMAAGTPVVGTDIAGTRQLIHAGENGWLAAPADPGALARAILAALSEPEKRALFSARLPQDVRPYSIENIAGQYAALYAELLGQLDL